MNSIIISIMNKELKNIFRDKFSIILLILPIFIFPLINIGTGYIFNDSQFFSDKSDVAIVNNENIDILEKYFENNSNMYNIINSDEPYKLLECGDIDFIVIARGDKTISFVYNSNYYSSLFRATSCGEEFEKELVKENKKNNPNLMSCNLEDEKGNSTNSESIISLITPIVFILVLCQGNSMLSNDMFAGEKERKTMELLLLSQAKKTTIYLGKVATLLIIELICTILSILSYTFSNSIISINGIEFSSLNYFIALTISAISLCIITVFVSTFISLISKSYRASQIANEIFSIIPVFAALYFLLRSSKISNNVISFIPIFNSVKSIVNTMSDETDIKFALSSFAINSLFCILLTIISSKYMKSEKALT